MRIITNYATIEVNEIKESNKTMSDHLNEILLESKEVASGKFIKLTQDKVSLPDGTHGIREYIKHPGGVGIIAITKDNHIVLEKQYRHPVRQIVLEIPAGKLELNEDILTAAKRELQEETGYTSNHWIKLGYSLPSIGYSSECLSYYIALDCKSGNTNLDQGEFIETITMNIDECFELAYSGKIVDGKTLAALMLYQGYLRQHQK